MNDSGDKHVPTDEFVEYLARDTARRLRCEARFATVPTVNTPRSRFTSLAIAAGVVVTLSTGMVLGASANYASAEVLPNGTMTIPTRPTLALLPIKNALTAIGCTQSVEHVAATTATTPTTVAVVSPTTEAAVANPATKPALNTQPDRAAIASLAKQHQAPVTRGDSAADYIVMAVDAAQNYLWSTHGNGNVSVEVGGDPRSLVERGEYNRMYAAEFRNTELTGTMRGRGTIDADRNVHIVFSVDSQGGIYGQSYRVKMSSDTVLSGTVRTKNGDTTFNVVTRRGGGGATGQSYLVRGRMVDSQSLVIRQKSVVGDSGPRIIVDGIEVIRPTQRVTSCARTLTLRGSGAVSPVSISQTTYTNGWSNLQNGARCNMAAGLQERTTGESGLIGLASTNVASADVYVFAAGELAPKELRVLVVQLTPGTAWSGR